MKQSQTERHFTLVNYDKTETGRYIGKGSDKSASETAAKKALSQLSRQKGRVRIGKEYTIILRETTQERQGEEYPTLFELTVSRHKNKPNMLTQIWDIV